jgi:hypothetical protein
MNCDLIAPHYQSLEYLTFGKSLERRRFAFLSAAVAARGAILCGGGDGRFLARLLLANPLVRVDFVEASSKMIELAERRISALGRAFRSRVLFRACDLRHFEPRQSNYDLIATHFFLDCFSQAEVFELSQRLASWASLQAQWIVSEFQEAPGVFANLASRVVIRALYAAFRISTDLRVTHLPDYEAALAATGFRLQCDEHSFAGLLRSSLWKRAI